ncbi:MAG: hypothetical protein M0R80_24895 [Proteobacteria bacterium]|jgi:hypothetical protein|nr:hypothetical protein [Pseudomonadota bacterium]
MYYAGSSNCRATGDRYEILGTAAFEAEMPKLTALERRLSTCYYLDMVARSGVGDISAALVPLAAQAHFKKARRAWSDGCRWELDLGACQGLQDKYRSCLEDYTSYCRGESTGLAKAELEKVQACEYMLRILPEDIASMDRLKEQAKSDADSVASVKANIWRMRAQAEASVQQAWSQFAVDFSQQLSTAAVQIAQNEQTIATARAAAAQRPAAPAAAAAPSAPGPARPPSASAAGPAHNTATCPAGQREVAPGKCACPSGFQWSGSACIEVALAPEAKPPQPTSTSGPSASSPQAPQPAQRQPDCTGMQGCLEISGPSAEESSYCKVNERGEKTYLPSVRNKCSVKLACKLCGSYQNGLRDCVEWYWEPGVTHGGWASPLVWCDTTAVVAWCVRDEEIENRSCLAEVP